MKLSGIILFAVVVIVLFGTSAHAALSNGDFEDLTGWRNTTVGRDNAAARQSGINAIGGSGTSAFMQADASVVHAATGLTAFRDTPSQGDEGIGVEFNTFLSAGDEHQVYFAAGTSLEDLPATPVTVTSTSYEPALYWSTQYVWRVDEFVDSTTYTGSVWTFTTTGVRICDPPLAADTNDDCVVDMEDLLEMALEWH